MVIIRPYVVVSNALEAIEFYKKVFDIEVLSHMPFEKKMAVGMGMSEDTDFTKTTMHSSISISGAVFYMSDNMTGEVLEKGNVALLIEPDSLEQAQKLWDSSQKNGCDITMKFEKQFWGDYFGSFKDPFGISWQINYSPPQD